MIKNILFPVDFSPSCAAMAGYVKRAAALLDAKVTLMHVVDLTSRNGFELYLRSSPEIAEERRLLGREKLDAFLTADLPLHQSARVLTSGDPATQIAQAVREKGFDLIIMPTHAGVFRRMLLGSTTAKVLNDADCPVLTSRHAETINPRPLEHREWLCAVDLSPDSERVLRFATQTATQARGSLSIIHAVQGGDPDLPVQFDIEEQAHSVGSQKARRRIAELQRLIGTEAAVRIAVGSVKHTLLETAQRSDADVLMIGRSPRPGIYGRLRDLTYAVIRDSPFPVLSI